MYCANEVIEKTNKYFFYCTNIVLTNLLRKQINTLPVVHFFYCKKIVLTKLLRKQINTLPVVHFLLQKYCTDEHK